MLVLVLLLIVSVMLVGLCQKVVHRNGTYAVKIKHQNCLLQVFKDYILTYKKLNGFKPYLWCTT